MKRLGLLLAAFAVGVLLFAVAVPAALRTAPPKERVSFTVLDRSHANALSRGYVRVAVKGTRAGRYRLGSALRRSRTSVALARTTVVRRDAKPWVLRVQLHRDALQRLRQCGAWRFELTFRRGGRRVGRTNPVLTGTPPCKKTAPMTADSRSQAPAPAPAAPAAPVAAAAKAEPAKKDEPKPADDTKPAADPKPDPKPDPTPDPKPDPKPDPDPDPDPGPGPGPGPDPEPEPDPVAPGFDTANFDRCDVLDPAVCMQPFPNNHFTKADDTTVTKRRVNFHRDSMPKNRAGKPIEPADYNHSDGFPAGTSIVTRVPGLDNAAAFRNTGAVPVDEPMRSLEADAPIQVINAETGKPHLVWSEIDANPPTDAERNLIIRPAKHFEEGARYIVVLRNLRDKDGKAIESQRPFQVFRDGIVTTDPKVEARRATMEKDIFEPLKKAGVNRKHLYLAWDFTVASQDSTTGRMLSIRDRAFAALGDTNLADRKIAGDSPTFAVNPNLPDDFEQPPTQAPQPDGIRDYESGAIARKVTGQIVVPCYLNAPGCPTGSKFQIGADGKPTQIPGNTTTYEWSCNIPRTSKAKLRPLLYGHGLLGDQQEIDWGGNPDFAAQYGFIYCAVDWNGMAFKDLPTVGAMLQDLSLFPALTDGVQQGMLGFLYLGRALLHEDGLSSHDAFQGKIDTTELFYDGNSQGGIYGGSLLAIAPDHERAVLGVPGMNYSTLLHRSVDFDGYAEGEFVDGFDSEGGMYDNYPSHLERPLLFSVVQMLWDRSDPSGYALHMTDDPLPNTPTHKALLQVGHGDHQVADVTTEVEARTIGAAVHRPLLPEGRERYRGRQYPDTPAPEVFQGVPSLGEPGYATDGSGVVFFSYENPAKTPAPWAANLAPRDGADPHGDVRKDPEGKQMKDAFLQTGGKIVDFCGGPCTMK